MAIGVVSSLVRRPAGPVFRSSDACELSVTRRCIMEQLAGTEFLRKPHLTRQSTTWPSLQLHAGVTFCSLGDGVRCWDNGAAY